MIGRKLLCSLVVVLGLAVTAPQAMAKQDVLFGGAAITGVYYQVALQISNMMNKHASDKYNYLGRPTGGSVFNINAIDRGAFDFAVAQSDRNWQGFNGAADWEGKPIAGLRSVFSMHPETVMLITNKAAGIKTVADLKGRTVALDKSSTSYFFFLSILEKNGLKESEVNIQEMGASDAGAAFVAGKVDAAVTWEPWLTNAGQREGGHVLISSREMPGTIVDVFVMNDNFIAKHPEVPAKMARAWFKAIEWYKANPAKGDEIMAKAFGLSAAEVADMAKGVTFKGAAENLAFVKPGQGLYAVADRAIRFWKEKGIIEKDVTAADFVTDKYVVEGAK